MTPSEYRVKGYSRLHVSAGHCDAPGCHMPARWKVTFTPSRTRFLCPRHKDEVAERQTAK